MPTTPEVQDQAGSFIDLPLELVHAILRHAALSGVESGQLRWTASLCLVSASVCHLVRPILYHTLVITSQNRDKFEQIAARSTNRQWLRDVRRVFLLGGYRSYAPMPDALFAAFDPSAIVAICAQVVVYRQFCPSESPACAFRPREVHFRDALLEFQLEDAAALAGAARVLGMFPLIAPTQGVGAAERMRAILGALPALTHLALALHECGWTPNVRGLKQNGCLPQSLRPALEVALGSRLQMLVVDVTNLRDEPDLLEENVRLVREFSRVDRRVQLLDDRRETQDGYVDLWERDWLAGRGVWDVQDVSADESSSDVFLSDSSPSIRP